MINFELQFTKYRLIEYKKSLDELERIMLALESAINDTGDDNI